jgi:hypothetical protein
MKSFAQLLQKRARGQKVAPDDYLVKKSAEKAIQELFGKIGLMFVRIGNFKEGRLELCCVKSVWRSEVYIQKEGIRSAINRKIGQEVVKFLKIKQ